jgi:hypothetical protein
VGRPSLREFDKLAGGLDYAAVSQAIARFSRRLDTEVALRARLGTLQRQLSK